MPLGRGLSSLIPKKERPILPEEEGRSVRVLSVPIDSIQPNPHQPRRHMEAGALDQLVSSIRLHGILQPLTVTRSTRGYELVAGERRLRAAQRAGLKTVPVIVRTVGELEKLELALIENIQREDLNPIERAHAYEKLLKEFGLTQEETARRLGKPRSVVANVVRLLDLPPEMQKAIADGRVSEGHAKILAGLSSLEQRTLFTRIVQQGLTVREVEHVARGKGKRRSASFKKNSSVFPEEQRLLEEKLSTKVEIQKRGVRGVITISFDGREEFERLVRTILE